MDDPTPSTADPTPFQLWKQARAEYACDKCAHLRYIELMLGAGFIVPTREADHG